MLCPNRKLFIRTPKNFSNRRREMQNVMATPSARREAKERRINLEKITGTGEGGYIQLSDVLRTKKTVTPLAKAYASHYGIDVESIEKEGRITKADVLNFRQTGDNLIPVRGMRSVIARRMKESLDTAPQYTTHVSVCVYELKKVLKAYTEKNIACGGDKPTYSDLLLKAAAMAIHDNMIINSSFCETHIAIHKDINIGLAVALEDGLIVPNIKNADKKKLSEITAERKRLVDKARAGKLMPEEYSGGTFTISNMGGYGVEYFTPIINLPESAILGVGAITDKVVPVDGNIGIRPMMGLSLTSDHRHIDGAASGAFFETAEGDNRKPIMHRNGGLTWETLY
jgi:pyruvate dehydrogenase E2 component (dihydrolipoamide acetyltransferase)